MNTQTAPQDRCHRNGVCALDAGFTFHAVCVRVQKQMLGQCQQKREQDDAPLFTPNFVLFAGIVMVLAAAVLGLLLGSIVVGYYDGPMTRAALAALRILGDIGWGAASRLT